MEARRVEGLLTSVGDRVDVRRKTSVVAWSTSELAELAGTTVKTIRHYHRIGLLDEPERTANNYKQYGVGHLVRLLQITRLTDLELPLAQIARIDEGDAESEQLLRLLDDDLAATIERLTGVRAELALILQHQSSTTLPVGFGPGSSDLSAADRALVLIYSRVLGRGEMSDLFHMMSDLASGPMHQDFDSLPPDADEASRQQLAERYAAHYLIVASRYPWMRNPEYRAPRGTAFVADTLGQVFGELYHPAQLDVVRRVNEIIENDDGSSQP